MKKTEANKPVKSEKVKYNKPKLTFFGKLAKLTLGASLPAGESGMTNTQMPS